MKSANAAAYAIPKSQVPTTNNQALHEKALKVLMPYGESKKVAAAKEYIADMRGNKKTVDAKKTINEYNERRKAVTAEVREVLAEVWAAFDRKETVGGASGKKEWCKQVGVFTYRRACQIVNGEDQTKVKSFHLCEGKVITIGKKKYVITNAPEEDDLHKTRLTAAESTYRASFLLREYKETDAPEPSDLVAHVKEERHYVYIGRKNVRGKRKFAASIWGNATGSLDKYEEYVRSSPELLHQLASLKGKVLGCWHTVADRRKGLVCHGDVLLKLIEEYDGKQLPPIPAVRSYADGAVTVETNWYTADETQALFEACAKLDFVRGEALFGKEKRHAVRIFCDGEAAVRAKKALSPLSEAPDAVEKLLADLSKHSGKNVNYAAVVEYRDGDDYIAPHQHNEDRGNDATVWIVSTGAERPFVVKPVNGDAATKFLATQGSLITLSSEANETHLHSVPKCKGCTGVRYSINCKAIPLDPAEATELIAVNASEESDKQSPPPAESDWIYIPQFLSQQEADSLYDLLLPLPWMASEDGSGQIAYGVSYDRGGPAPNEFAEIPELLRRLGDRVSQTTRYPWNFAQLHKYVPARAVFPHVDPPLVVPMLTLGQERAFRYGGTMHCEKCEQSRMPICPHYFSIRQKNRPVEAHQPEQETLMRHGDLLVFYGSGVIHSMYPASRDSQFNPNGREFRFSLLFRYTTEAMREFGVGKCNRHGHEKQYRDAVRAFRARQASEVSDDEAA
jgi:hypothetical protein